MSNNFTLSLIYTGFKRVERWWNYKNVISPFYRLYYIEQGSGRININNIVYDLTPGTMFLIPKFTFHSYECDDFMDHYYVCFFDDVNSNLGIQNPSELCYKVQAGTVDRYLFQRYLELNPHRSLTEVDPKRYDNNKNIYQMCQDHNSTARHISHLMESSGIVLQLFSRFITEQSIRKSGVGNSYEKLKIAVHHIHDNMDKRVSVLDLAKLIHLTPDHFSKVFKTVMGMSPCEYIQLKRIERAQALLLTSNMSIMQIGESVGVFNQSQFTRLFTKIAQCSPKEYRAKQLSI